jgi:hypothetical protein
MATASNHIVVLVFPFMSFRYACGKPTCQLTLLTAVNYVTAEILPYFLLAIMIHLSLGVGNNTWRNGNATYYLGAACMHTKDTDVFTVLSRNDWFLVCHTRGLFPMPHC